MEYFTSHIGVIFGAACFVAIAATSWWYLTEKNAELKRQRAKARREAQAKKDE
ncbi:MAG: hypothetical protein IKE52_05095 [Mogibacterium sp.]|nr:hypothetical protein [Mogibacterium sp.]